MPGAVADDQFSNSTNSVAGDVCALIEHFMFDEDGFANSRGCQWRS